jgi:hypothetical protein
MEATRRVGAAAVAFCALLAIPASAHAQTIERGATLDPARAPNFNSDCATKPFPDINDPNLSYFPVNSGQPSCSWWQTGVFGSSTDPRTGYVPADGTITSITVRSGANPAPIRFVVVRQLTSTGGGGEECCFFVSETAPVQPTASTTSTFAVNIPVESNRDPRVFTDDILGISAATGAGSLPIYAIPGQTNANAFTQPGTVDAAATYPAMGAIPNDSGGGRRPEGYAGFELQLRYTFVPTPAPTGPTGPGPTGPTGPTGPGPTLGPTDITTIGGNVLRPSGGALDVTLNCLQTTCAGSVAVLTRPPELQARKDAEKVKSLGSSTFTLNQGDGQEVGVKLNALGRKLAKHKKTKVNVIVDLGTAGQTSKPMTLKGPRRG